MSDPDEASKTSGARDQTSEAQTGQRIFLSHAAAELKQGLEQRSAQEAAARAETARRIIDDVISLLRHDVPYPTKEAFKALLEKLTHVIPEQRISHAVYIQNMDPIIEETDDRIWRRYKELSEQFSERAPRTSASSSSGEEQSVPEQPSSENYADLRAQLSEARAEVKISEALGRIEAGFAGINGRLDVLNSRVEGVERTTSGIKTTVITTGIATGIAVVGVTAAILTYGQTWFGLGLTTRDVVKTTVSEEMERQRQSVPPGQSVPPAAAPTPGR